MPGDDITHPIPDLSGYITEGQILISRELHRKGIYPPVDIRPSLSRLMNSGIGKGHTREDHRAVSDQLYAYYAEGNDLRGLAAIVGKEALSERDKLVLEFADKFEKRFVNQGRDEDRSIFDTLQIGWDLLADLPEAMLTRIDDKYIKQYHPKYASTAKAAKHRRSEIMPVIRGTKPTRAVLIALKKRMKVAKTGHSLLKMKRDGLMIEFFEVLSKAKTVRKELVEALLKAEQRLQMAMAIEGTVAIGSVAYSLQKEPAIQLESRNIMGVVVPKITSEAVQKKMYERGYGIIGTSAAIDEAADAYESLLDKIILAAEVETAMIRLVEDIDSTKRRVNALEFKVIPELKDTIKFIAMALGGDGKGQRGQDEDAQGQVREESRSRRSQEGSGESSRCQGFCLIPEAMSNWFERKAEDWFGTPEKKMRLLQWLVYITNLYIIFGIFVLIWILYGEYIIEAWNHFMNGI